MTQHDMNAPEEWEGAVAPFAQMKILIVDDDPVSVALLEDMLCGSGYTNVKSIMDSRHALETCKTFLPDLVLLDLLMPRPDGLAVLRSLRSQASKIYLPIIVLTADANEESKRRALRAGATDFLLKPFDQIEVFLRIKNLLETRHLNQLLENRCAMLEDAVSARSLELRTATGGAGKSAKPPGRRAGRELMTLATKNY
jgi:PleD family two-component response regulator